MSGELIPFQDQQRMAQAIAKSGFFGLKDETQVLALMAVAQAEGRHPASVAKDYHIIQNRPALKADAMLARFQKAGGSVKWDTYTDEVVTGTFSHPQGGSLAVSWTLAQAKAIGLAGKDNWKMYPRAMLRARVISEGIRAVYPAVIVGEYTPEEVGDFDNVKQVMDAASVSHVIQNMKVVDKYVVEEPENEPENFVPFYVPEPDGSSKLYKACRDDDEWKETWAALIAKINKAKISDEVKSDKFFDLKQVNSEAFERIM